MDDGVKVVRLSVSMSASDYGVSASGVMFKTFVDRLEELSGGKMVAQVFPASQLASTTDDIVNGLVTGAFEMSEVGQANWGDYTTAFTPLNVPFLYSSNETVYEIMNGEIGDSMRQQLLDDTGLRAVGFLHLGMRTITNNQKEIHSPADLKGMKLRVQSDPTQIAAFEELGCSVIHAAFSGWLAYYMYQIILNMLQLNQVYSITRIPRVTVYILIGLMLVLSIIRSVQEIFKLAGEQKEELGKTKPSFDLDSIWEEGKAAREAYLAQKGLQGTEGTNK